MITFESIFSKKNIAKAYEHLAIKKNGVATDKASTKDIEEYWNLNRDRILEEISEFRFKPNAILEYEIINGKGKHRRVTNYSDSDRFITRLISQKLNQFFLPLFSDFSYAYQENKGTLAAVQQAKEYIENGKDFVVEIDIKNFFDEVNIELLINILRKYILDKKVLYLIEKYLYCTISCDGEVYKKTKGIVQGCSMSPCLSNLYLDEFDKSLDTLGYNWIRFADNIYIYVDSEEVGISIYKELKDILEIRYMLPINETKSGIFEVYDRRLLGYDFYRRGKKVKVEKHTYQHNDYYRNWHECAVEKINREYHITKTGVLNKKDYALLFENADEKHHIPVEATEQLNVYNEITITSAVIRTIANERIRLGMYDKHGDLLGYFIPEGFYQDSKMILAQCMEHRDDAKRLQIAKAMEIAAIHNIRANIRYYMKHTNSEDLRETEHKLTDGIKNMNQCKTVNDLLLEEARCRQVYYQALNSILDNSYFEFVTRSRRPPKIR